MIWDTDWEKLQAGTVVKDEDGLIHELVTPFHEGRAETKVSGYEDLQQVYVDEIVDVLKTVPEEGE